jgi:hypothetical protein
MVTHHEKSRLLNFFPKWVKAFTLGQHIFYRHKNPSYSLINHETVHTEQYKKQGIIKFLWIYFVKEWDIPYREKTFEKEAYKISGNL